MTNPIHAVYAVAVTRGWLAAPADPQVPQLPTAKPAITWIQQNVAYLIIAFVGVILMLAARRKDHSGVLLTIALLVVGLSVLFVPDAWINLGKALGGLITPG